MPLRKKSGAKLTTMISVELRIGIRTSREALYTSSMMGTRSASGSARFWRMCLYTFSTSTMASSTSEPMAMASPPRVMVLMLMPRALSTIIATRNEMGIVTSEMTVVRTLARNIIRMITTKMAPSMSDFCTLSMLLSMKSAWRKMSVEICTSEGRVCLRSSSARSRCFVRSMVLVLGCFVTVRSTADWARSLATPSFGDWLPIFMSATSARVTTLSPFFFTMLVPSFSTSLVEVMPRMMYSLPYL